MHLSTQLFSFLLVSANGLYCIQYPTSPWLSWGKFKGAQNLTMLLKAIHQHLYILLNNSLPFVYLLAGSVAYTIHKPRLSFFQTNKRTRESSTNLETNILTTTRYTAKKRRFRTNYRDILHLNSQSDLFL